MKPSKKSKGMEQALTDIFGFDRRENITANKCCPPPIGCGGPAVEFHDELSAKEYTISGLCQKCQDLVFGEDGEGAKMWTLEKALPLLRELEQAAREWSCHVALAGSVLYQGYSGNDLDIHIYKRNEKDTWQPQRAFNWFSTRGWELERCGEERYEQGNIYEAFQGGRKLNVFFMRLAEDIQ